MQQCIENQNGVDWPLFTTILGRHFGDGRRKSETTLVDATSFPQHVLPVKPTG
jgi:hypothetical protein